LTGRRTLVSQSLEGGAMSETSTPVEATDPPADPPEVNVEVHHKPKAVHGWREFLAEYAIIVLGVLTALTAEQVAEHLRWEGAVASGRDALHRELAFDTAFMRDRLLIAPCVDRNIVSISAMIETAASTGGLPKTGELFKDPSRRVETSEWETERASQSLTHFPREERARLERDYDQISEIKVWEDQELDAWTRLAVLKDGPKRLGEADIAQLRVAVQTVKSLEWLMTLNGRRVLDWSKTLGVTPDPTRQAWVHDRCPTGQ